MHCNRIKRLVAKDYIYIYRNDFFYLYKMVPFEWFTFYMHIIFMIRLFALPELFQCMPSQHFNMLLWLASWYWIHAVHFIPNRPTEKLKWRIFEKLLIIINVDFTKCSTFISFSFENYLSNVIVNDIGNESERCCLLTFTLLMAADKQK